MAVNKPTTKKPARVPVVMQLEEVECGAACLSMVLSYYDTYLPLEQVRLDCGVSRDGSSARRLVKAARRYGLIAEGFKAEPVDLLTSGTFPCIVFWNFNHFVVLRGFKGGKAYINDPAMGAYSIPMEEFDEAFTGVCLMFRPGEDYEPRGRRKSMLSFARRRLQGNGRTLAILAAFSAIGLIFGIIEPGFDRFFVDYLLPGRADSLGTRFLIALIIFSVLQVIAGYAEDMYTLKVCGRLDAEAGSTFMRKVFRLPMEFFYQRQAGDIRSRQDTNSGIVQTLIDVVVPLFFDAFMLVFYLMLMLVNSPLLSLIGMASILFNIIISMIISRRRLNYTRVSMRYEAKLSSETLSGLDMIETIKASGAEQGYFRRWAGYLAGVQEQTVRFEESIFPLELLMQLVSTILDMAVLIVGIYLVMAGHFTIGLLMAFQGFLDSFMAPVDSFIGSAQTINELRSDMERVDDVLDYRDDALIAVADVSACGQAASDSRAPLRKLSGAIELRNVTFGYSPLAEPLIKNLNLKIEPGMKLAIVGGSGSGKSTIAALIAGLYQPRSGEILFDGKPMKEIDRTVFRNSVGVVDQDVILFDGTVGENIRMWDDTTRNFEMILAARDARVHDVIITRNGGYNTLIKDGGANFSGGQCQRMEIARVLAQDPTIMVLDEATSALDAVTEYEVIRSIADRGCTCIVIAHRLSTIRDSNLIIVLDEGTIADSGTHEELMESCEIYRQLILSE